MSEPWSREAAPRLRDAWARHGALVLRFAAGLMSLLALVWLSYESWRLLFQTTQMGAIDLHLRYDEVHAWFAHQPVYNTFVTAVYPPATYAILWPVTGWLDWTPARWLWAFTTVGALAWLGTLFVRASGARTRLEQVFVLLIPLATYPIGAAIGNGQLIAHQLPLLIAAVLLLQRRTGLWADALAALMLLLALVKPTTAAPFFWPALFATMRWRATILAGAAYLAVTQLAAVFQPGGAIALVGMSLANGASLSAVKDPTFYGNVHVWLTAAGLSDWAVPVSLLLLLALGGWTFLNRRADVWILIGVAGIFARLWTYHGWYDDALLLPALIALYRLARTPAPRGADVIAGLLLGLNLLLMPAPGGLFVLPPPLNVIYTSVQSLLWLTLLAFLMYCARRPLPQATAELPGAASWPASHGAPQRMPGS